MGKDQIILIDFSSETSIRYIFLGTDRNQTKDPVMLKSQGLKAPERDLSSTLFVQCAHTGFTGGITAPVHYPPNLQHVLILYMELVTGLLVFAKTEEFLISL